MQGVLELAAATDDIASFARAYFTRLGEILHTLDMDALSKLAARLNEARLDGNTVFVAGNGGSATTATSMANDLGFDVLKKADPGLTFRLHALTDSNAALTAIANDVGYDTVFVDQLRVHYRKGDLLLVISASGNSSNVVRAAEWVLEQGGTVMALVGFAGGRLAEMADVVLHFRTVNGEYGPAEDAHLVLNHILAHWFQVKLKGDARL